MKYILIMLVGLPFFLSCGKNSATPTNTAPTNMTLNAVVSSDNSGNVSFTAAATNAVSYDYDYGNGIFQTVASGIVTYKYPASGTYTVNVIAKSSSGQTISKSTSVTVTVALSLVWSDEFDTPGSPDASKWTFDTGGGGWGNAEQEYYTNRIDNAVVSNGTLKIIAKAETYSGSNYTSARLKTQNIYSTKYGRIEVRAKLPASLGTWPAIWMLGNNIATAGWPACGEIDIMEQRATELNKIYGTLHYLGEVNPNGDGATTTISSATTDFHIYAVDWDASSIKISVDNTVFYTFANTAGSPFNQNFFVILNLAMGGNFGGTIDPAFTTDTLEIDYVRVYQ